MRIKGYTKTSHVKAARAINKALKGAEKALHSLQATEKQLHVPDIEDKDSELVTKYERVVASLAGYIGRLVVDRDYHSRFIKKEQQDESRTEKTD